MNDIATQVEDAIEQSIEHDDHGIVTVEPSEIEEATREYLRLVEPAPGSPWEVVKRGSWPTIDPINAVEGEMYATVLRSTTEPAAPNRKIFVLIGVSLEEDPEDEE
jgi:hypothetical protein